MDGHVACIGQIERGLDHFRRKTDCQRSLEIHRYREENNIKICRKEILCEVMDWILLAQGQCPVLGCSANGKENSGSIKDEDSFTI
jgi:hypothetical protein